MQVLLSSSCHLQKLVFQVYNNGCGWIFYFKKALFFQKDNKLCYRKCCVHHNPGLRQGEFANSTKNIHKVTYIFFFKLVF